MVTIYTVQGCPKCAILKKKATELGIEYIESHDVQDAINAGFTTAPVMKVDNEFYAFSDALKCITRMRG